jgi:hypothetical protein
MIDQFTPYAAAEVARVLQFGARKHPRREASPATRKPDRYRAAITRHNEAGERIDPETHCHPLAHVASRALLLLDSLILRDAVAYPNLAPRQVPPFACGCTEWVEVGRASGACLGETASLLVAPLLLDGLCLGWRADRIETILQRLHAAGNDISRAVWCVERRCTLWVLHIGCPELAAMRELAAEFVQVTP